ncbi:MAG: Mov34/MPN/PAD-1 family protein [Actinobacteria bacterium]|nr:Mov34/MPN/PAD-1 family protein [Actinomycetota bacterium]
MADVEFWSEDRAFGLQIPTERLSRVLELSRTAAPEETGGVLAGYYTDAHNCAVVTEASDAPPDSRSGRTFFVRGTTELQRWLNKLWRRERRFYLGDWHSHLGNEPSPSPTDLTQLKEIANDELCKCPEPVLLLVGGRAANARDVRAYVFPKNKGLIELYSAEL